MKPLYLAALALFLTGSTAGAAPANTACSGALCGASGLPLNALAAAAREDKPAARDEPRRSEPKRDAWTGNLGAHDDRENYNCALSFGVGGQLSKNGFVGSRVMGQTQTWRAPESNSSKP